MKKFICTAAAVMSLLLSSCEKNAVDQASTSNQRDLISEQARQFSIQHDRLVQQMVLLDEELLMQRSPSQGELTPDEIRAHWLSVIEQVTGVKPVVADRQSSKVLAAEEGSDPANYWVSLDVEEITLAQYAVSEAATTYLGAVDDLVQNEELSLDEKQLMLQQVIDEVKSDESLPLAETERVLTAVEVLKGSMSLWSEFQSTAPPMSVGTGMMKASIRNWSFWKKLGFVSAADAVGGVLGLFMGGYIVVNGVPIYLPAGTVGMVGGAAALSYIASKMVGW